MLFQALLSSARVRGELDRAALAAHASMLEHGFVCVGGAEPPADEAPELFVSTAPDGSLTLRLLPMGWNASSDSFAFCYVHPLRDASETFSLKALANGNSLSVDAASSLPGGELLTVTLKVGTGVELDADPAAVAARAKEWQEKTSAGIAVRLLARCNSTARLGKVLDASEPATAAADRTHGTKRPAPEGRRAPDGADRPARPWLPGRGDLDFVPGGRRGDDDGPPLLWTPDGGLLGPRHPAWGQVVPGGVRGGPMRGGGGGLMPRFDPIVPGHPGMGFGEPDPDHLRIPRHPDFPGLHGVPAPGRGGRMDPDGMFMM